MFELSKTAQAILNPINLIVFLLFFGVLMSRSEKAFRAILGNQIILFLSGFLFLCAIFPVGAWSLVSLENKTKNAFPDTADGILLLTGDESPRISEARTTAIAGQAAQRYIMFAKLAQKYPSARLVVVGRTGQSDPKGLVTTRAISQDILKSIGVPATRVTYEEQSRTTFENAVLAKNLVKPEMGETWILVTSAYHMPRAHMTFENLDWPTVPMASDYFTTPTRSLKPVFDFAGQMQLMKLAVHEYGGLIYYWKRGWTQRPW